MVHSFIHSFISTPNKPTLSDGFGATGCSRGNHVSVPFRSVRFGSVRLKEKMPFHSFARVCFFF